MSEKNEEFNIKNEKEKKYMKITLKTLLAIIILIFLIAIIIVSIFFEKFYEKNEDKDVFPRNAIDIISSVQAGNNVDLNVQSENNYYNNTDENYYEYDFGDYYEDSYDDYYEYDEMDEYSWNVEYAIDFLEALKSNPFYTIISDFDNYSILKNIEKKDDGSYNINMEFSDLTNKLYYQGMDPSMLKSNAILSTNINVLSETQINVKDTGINKEYWTYKLTFDKIAEDEYSGYYLLEEVDNNDSEYKYLEVTVKFTSKLISEISYNEVSKSELPEEALEESYDYIYDNEYDDEYSYSYYDYIS